MLPNRTSKTFYANETVYDPIADGYVPIKIWENPNDKNDYLVMAKLASRQAREKEFSSIAKTPELWFSNCRYRALFLEL